MTLGYGSVADTDRQLWIVCHAWYVHPLNVRSLLELSYSAFLETRKFIYFYVGPVSILLWKTS